MTVAPRPYPSPQRDASIMLAFRPRGATLVVGASNRLSASRVFAALEADSSSVVVLSRGGVDRACEELRWRAQTGEVELLGFDELAGGRRAGSGQSSTSQMDQEALELAALERFLENRTPGSVSLVFITDTLISSDSPGTRRSKDSARQMYDVCRKWNIPVNVTDMPELCDFTVCSSHRFSVHEDGNLSSLQVGVSTNGRGCRLASRVKREVVARLPPEVGLAVEKVGRLRALAKELDDSTTTNVNTNGPASLALVTGIDSVEDAEIELNEEMTVSSPNRPVEQRWKESTFSEKEQETKTQRVRRRMKWVAQISEYWSFAQLASLTEEDMKSLLAGELLSQVPSAPRNSATSLPFSQHGLSISPPSEPSNLGQVLLVGSGPGHPSLLTLAAHNALTSLASLILADKLVPAPILSLIPPHIELRIARKFPGNADGAQQELLDIALAAAREGKTVVRLKQGDPALYGRVGEEILFLRKHGIKTLVIPGISSALAAPLFAGIPVTQRGAADSLAVATGVGRGGAPGRIPGYERARTFVLLMGNARLESLVNTLLSEALAPQYPANVPAAIIERASMPDQRVISAPLCSIVPALESVGEQRPPGLLVVGWAVLSLWGEGDMGVLDVSKKDDSNEGEAYLELEKRDEERIEKWLGGRRWRVIEGLDPFWDAFMIPDEKIVVEPAPVAEG